MMRSKVFKSLILLMSALMLCLSGCSEYKKINMTSVGVQTISPDGLRGLDADLLVGIDNPAGKVKISDIEAEIFHSGKILGRMAIAPFELEAKTEKVYDLDTKILLDEKVSVLDVAKLLGKGNISECTVNLSAKVKVAGISKKIRRTDIPLRNFLKLIKK